MDLDKHLVVDWCVFPQNALPLAEKHTIMVLAIKAIPTLYGDDAINFREKADSVEKKFLTGKAKDRSKDSFVVKMHEMLKRSGF